MGSKASSPEPERETLICADRENNVLLLSH